MIKLSERYRRGTKRILKSCFDYNDKNMMVFGVCMIIDISDTTRDFDILRRLSDYLSYKHSREVIRKLNGR